MDESGVDSDCVVLMSVMSLSQPSGAGDEGQADKLHGLTTQGQEVTQRVIMSTRAASEWRGILLVLRDIDVMEKSVSIRCR